ncbi:hypothetical protein [Streptomyces sp. NPDC059597]|uniref:hypothetical protein n=1 Tax=Streptomyces sp. NPDC059597 TaxID=3346879 RepID=UPI0036BB3A34
MSGRGRPRGSGGRLTARPRTLRTRLVVASVALLAVVVAVIGTVTTLALHELLCQQLDRKVSEIAQRAVGRPFPLPDTASPGGPAGGIATPADTCATPAQKVGALLTKGPRRRN